MFRKTIRILLLSGTLPLVAGTALAHDHEVLRGRLLFADHEKSVVRVLDLDSGAVTDTIETTKPNVSLMPTNGGRFFVIRTGDEKGTVQFIDSGLFHERHEDHADIEKGPVKRLGLTLTGDNPAHVVSENGWVSVFYDGKRPWLGKSEPKVVSIKLDTFEQSEPLAVVWPSPAPQHGIAVPIGKDEWLMSISKESYAKATSEDKTITSRPNGFQILDRTKNWNSVATFNDPSDRSRFCKEYHGHASLNGTHVLGCNSKLGDSSLSDGGLLMIEKDPAGRWSSRKLDYPDERRASTIKGSGKGQYVVANYGGKAGAPFAALLRIDPKAKSLSMKDVFTIPEKRDVCQYEVTGDGKSVVNLTSDGKLRVYELAPEWKEMATFEAVMPFDCAWDAKTPSPSLTIVGNSAFVSDPDNGRIREFYLNGLKQGLDYSVGGKPTRIAGGGAE